ncbi:MAG: hypothetical protein R6U63_03930 [Longimicrobiales bacterium]
MKLLRTASVLVLSAFALTACDDDATGVEIDDLAGLWNATQFEYTDQDNTAFSVDVIGDLAGSLSLDVSEDGSFTGTIEIQLLETGPVPMQGTFSINGDTLSIDFTGQASAAGLVSNIEAAFTLNGDVLTLTNDDVSFDFPDTFEASTDGIEVRGEVPAILEVRLSR